MMVAGSVCKDWSSMGKSQQWLGQYAILCAIFIALTRHLQCSLVIHECTARFDYKLLQDLMPDHQDFHTVLSPTNFGCPVSRTRSYDVLLLKGKLKLPKGLRELHKLCVPCTLDAGVWLEAPDDMVTDYQKYLANIAMRGSSSPWVDILPPTAQANLSIVRAMPKVVEALKYHEVATNLDQCPDHQEHIGTTMPTILASISHMYAVKADRPFIPQASLGLFCVVERMAELKEWRRIVEYLLFASPKDFGRYGHGMAGFVFVRGASSGAVHPAVRFPHCGWLHQTPNQLL
ncbi:unnamed protein product [Durusdinium trenchii]|uniref:Uncharacterized protein n=2 Tax=Durusdinium trenchii TaxID=1381693 RepID=A0ABP0MQK3_9DINO